MFITQLSTFCFVIVNKNNFSDCSADDDDEEKVSFVSTATLDDIKAGKYNIVYMHPETIFSKEVGRLLRARLFKPMVCSTVIDEVHMISEW